LVNEDSEKWASFEAHHASPLLFFVARSGYRLRVFDMEGQPVITFAKVEALTTMLGNAIGQRVASV
jgi:hypothetical protein